MTATAFKAPTGLREPASDEGGSRVSGGSGAEPLTGPEGALLENTANNFSPDPLFSASDYRKRRYEARAFLWHESTLDRVRGCGHHPVNPAGYVAVRLAGGMAGFAGLPSCGSVWADPVCNAKIMARRAVEIGAAVEAWMATGGRVAFVTFTQRHRKGQKLRKLWDALQGGWHRVTGGKGWTLDRESLGLVGWLRVVEINWGSNGWHIHIHALLFIGAGVTDEQLQTAHGRMFARWSAGLEAGGLARPLMSGQDCRVLTGAADEDLSRYFTKAVHKGERIGLEFTRSQSKRVRVALGTAPVWALLDDARVGDLDALALWREYEQASKGRRQLTWSRGLRELLGLRAEKSDEEIAEEELGTCLDDLVWITGWDRVRELGLAPEILRVTEQGGMAALVELLDASAIEYVRVS